MESRAQSLPQTMGVIMFDLAGVVRDPGLKYWKRTVNQAAYLFWSSAPLAIWLCFFLGLAISVQTINVLGQIGADRGLTGILVGSLGLRELAVIVGSLSLGASAGAGSVTELGAMRVAEEIDAIETMSVSSRPYLLSTRVFATVIASLPIIVFCVGATFLGGWVVAWTQSDSVSVGSFGYFFWLSLAPMDFVFALMKGAVIATSTAVICTSFGYRAGGGPVGVGLAVGRALNLSIIAAMLINLAMSYMFWGVKDTLRL